MTDTDVEETLAEVLEWLEEEPYGSSEEELAALVAFDEDTLRAALELGVERGRLYTQDGLYRLAEGGER